MSVCWQQPPSERSGSNERRDSSREESPVVHPKKERRLREGGRERKESAIGGWTKVSGAL